MTAAAPDILVQIVHIEGPRKGEIQEFCQERITFGRDASCDVVFPKDLRFISRHHAEINREGNRFHLVNRSPNGCLVNSRPAEEAYLKQGDVITLAEGGPKVSFLSSVLPQGQARPVPSPAAAPAWQPPAWQPPSAPVPAPEPAPRQLPSAAEAAPFTIQYETSIRSFRQPAVKLGSAAPSDFVFRDPRVFGVHAELSYRQGKYFIRDLTESHATLLNGRALPADTPLREGDVLELCEAGPKLRYLGEGRLAEVIEAAPRPSPAPPQPTPASGPPETGSLSDRLRSLFRK